MNENASVQELQHRLTVLETLVRPLFDNGQPGVLTKLYEKIDESNRNMNRLTLIVVLQAALSVGGIPLAHVLGWLK